MVITWCEIRTIRWMQKTLPELLARHQRCVWPGVVLMADNSTILLIKDGLFCMSAAFKRSSLKHIGAKTESNDNFGALVGTQSERLCTAFRHCWQNMHSSLHARNERTVETVDFTRRTGSKEGENGSIGRKGFDHRFLGFARHHLYRVFGEGKDNHGAALC